jgi:hypothetical protein
LEDVFDLETNVVVNCSGLEAMELAPDKIVKPVKGQMLFLGALMKSYSRIFVSIGEGEYCLVQRIADVGLGTC